MKRRTWLLGAAGAAGALVVGCGVLPQRSRTGSRRLWPPAEGEVAFSGWIKILRDGAVVLAMPQSEMGQGVHTALAMLAAGALRYSQPANGACGHPQRSASGVLALGGAFTQCFFSESSVDEIAVELKQDPLALRRQLLAQASRYLVVLELAASRAGWRSPLPPQGGPREIALNESFGSVVAHVAEVSAPGGWLRVHRVMCAIDCGSVANALFALNGTRVRSLPLQH